MDAEKLIGVAAILIGVAAWVQNFWWFMHGRRSAAALLLESIHSIPIICLGMAMFMDPASTSRRVLIGVFAIGLALNVLTRIVILLRTRKRVSR